MVDRARLTARLTTLRTLLLEATASGEPVPDVTASTQAPLEELDDLIALAREFVRARAATRERIEELLDVVVALVSFDYERKASISDANDLFDGMASALNMLGEELASSTVSRAYMTNILESMDDAVFVVDLDGQITTANPAAGELLARESDALIGRPLAALLPSFDLRALLERGGARELELELEASDTRPARTISLTASPMRERGQTRGLVCVVRDISERLRLEAERWRLREAVQRQAILVDELSTPLIPITDELLVMPLVGPIDAQRAGRMVEVLLTGIAARKAKVAILDITGVHAIGADAIDGLGRATRAAALLGARVLLTGVRPDVVTALLELDAKLEGLDAFATLETGIVSALEQIGTMKQLHRARGENGESSPGPPQFGAPQPPPSRRASWSS